MYLPRRFRRRLLSPPGWVALGCLLWLRCLVVQGQWRRQESVMQLSMPLLKSPSNDSDAQVFTVQGGREALSQARHWQKLVFTGRLSDSLVLRRLRRAVAGLNGNVQVSQGLAVCFAGPARYQYLVATIDLLNQHDVRRYMLDIYQTPTTLYALHNRFRVRQRHHPMLPHQPLELR